MSAISDERKIINTSPKQPATITTLNNPKLERLSHSRVRRLYTSFDSIKTPVNAGNYNVKTYYNPPISEGEGISSSQTREFTVIPKLPERFIRKEIVVAKSTIYASRTNISYAQTSGTRNSAEYIDTIDDLLSIPLPCSESKVQDFEADDESDLDEEEPFWRDVFPLPSSSKLLFSKKLEVKVDELPSWEPHIVIDSDRLEDDDE